MIAVGWCNALGNYIIHSSVLRCLASLSDNNQVDLVLDDAWRTEIRQAIQLIAERSPFIRKVVGYPSEYRAKDYQHSYMTFHSIFQSSFFQYLHGHKVMERENYVCWADLLHEQDFYLSEIRKQFGYKGVVYDQYVPVSKVQLPAGLSVCISNGWSRANEGIWKRKEYPFYQELIEALLTYYDELRIYLIGDHNDNEWASFLLSVLTAKMKNERVVNLCGQLSILQTIDVVAEGDFGVYNDGAIAHIADALKKPGVVLWGSTLVSKNGPLNGTLTNLRSPLLCSPCQGTVFFKKCENTSDCMAAIDVGLIMANIRKNFLTNE